MNTSTPCCDTGIVSFATFVYCPRPFPLHKVFIDTDILDGLLSKIKNSIRYPLLYFIYCARTIAVDTTVDPDEEFIPMHLD